MAKVSCILRHRGVQLILAYSWAMLVGQGGPGVSLTLCCFLAYSTKRFVLSLALCYYVLYFSVLLTLQFPRLGKRQLVLLLFVR